MGLSEKDVRDIATYVRIGLTDEEVSRMTVDLNDIIESLKPITEMDLEGVEPTFHPIAGLSNVMRDDEVAPSLSVESVLSNSEHVQDDSFVVPTILAGGDI